jgi:hypothetical protein
MEMTLDRVKAEAQCRKYGNTNGKRPGVILVEVGQEKRGG